MQRTDAKCHAHQAGEILAGALLGPQLADIVPEPQALQLFGQFGLYLLARALHRERAAPR
jgi:hypothetical protein